jgi:tetratricopeptide (TPR) repeat protein
MDAHQGGPGGDDARLEEIVRAVVAALDAERTPPPSVWRRIGGSGAWVVKNAAGLLALGALLLIGIGLVARGINPLTVPDTLVEDYRQSQDRSELVDEHVAIGNDLLNIGQPEAAKKEFEAALALDESSSEASLGVFKTQLFEPIGRGGSDPAIYERRLLHLARKYPDDSHAAAYYADALVAGSALEDATTEYDRALGLDSANATAVVGKGIVEDLQNHPEQALAYYQQAEGLSPNTQAFVNNVAYQLFRLGRYDEAIAKYRQLLDNDDRFLLSYYILAQALRIQGDLESAAAYQRAALQLLADKEVSQLLRNSNWWLFHTSDVGAEAPAAGVVVRTLDEKRYYAALSHALTLHVSGRSGAARAEVVRARKLGVDALDRNAIAGILAYDAQLLGAHQPQLAASGKAFTAWVARGADH